MNTLEAIAISFAQYTLNNHWVFVLILGALTAFLCFKIKEFSPQAARGCLEKSLLYMLIMCGLNFVMSIAPYVLLLIFSVIYGYAFSKRASDCASALCLYWSNPTAFKKLCTGDRKQSHLTKLK